MIKIKKPSESVGRTRGTVAYSIINSSLRRNFGITLEEYNNMFKHQNGKCAICGIHQFELKKRFSVDHCHRTGKIRGLLCGNCNKGLGMFADDTGIVESALYYLIYHK